MQKRSIQWIARSALHSPHKVEQIHHFSCSDPDSFPGLPGGLTYHMRNGAAGANSARLL